MQKWEKGLEILSIFIVIIATICKVISGTADMGVLVILAFAAIMVYVILLVCAFFPADWRMTAKQKEKIQDMQAYQAKYRKIFVVINFVMSIFFSMLIIFIS